MVWVYVAETWTGLAPAATVELVAPLRFVEPRQARNASLRGVVGGFQPRLRDRLPTIETIERSGFRASPELAAGCDPCSGCSPGRSSLWRGRNASFTTAILWMIFCRRSPLSGTVGGFDVRARLPDRLFVCRSDLRAPVLGGAVSAFGVMAEPFFGKEPLCPRQTGGSGSTLFVLH